VKNYVAIEHFYDIKIKSVFGEPRFGQQTSHLVGHAKAKEQSSQRNFGGTIFVDVEVLYSYAC
jgi:hypothetical protein